nr:Arm DNA-binding domain-containing protein [Methylocella silvestris]
MTARAVASLKEPGRHADGGGLCLQIRPTGSNSWLFLLRQDGKRREMGMGAAPDVGLAEAREKAEEARRVFADSRDPIEADMPPIQLGKKPMRPRPSAHSPTS